MNTWPLVWGFLHGPQRGLFDFRFDLPAVCADSLASDTADVGLVPCAELNRLGLDFLPRLGIATDADVRSILLISQVPFQDIKILAADSSSRTSIALTRILLREKYGCQPEIRRELPEMKAMLCHADAALIIGDPALRIDPGMLPYYVMDLGAEWVSWSGLPMVFAVWAGRTSVLSSEVAAAFDASFEWGRTQVEQMVERAAVERHFDRSLARDYLTKHIVYRLSPRHLEGLALFRRLASALETA